MKRLLIAVAIVAAVAMAAPAQAQDVKFKVFGGMSYVSPLSDETVDIGDVTDSIEAASELGYTLGFEWRMSKLFGLELDYVDAKHDVEFAGTKIGDVKLQPLSATLNFHLIHTKMIDFYLGPTVSYVSWGDINLNEDGQDALGVPSVPTDSEVAYGASVGLDIGLGKSFAIVGGVRYLKLDVTPEEGDGLGVDPLLTRVGVAFRW